MKLYHHQSWRCNHQQYICSITIIIISYFYDYLLCKLYFAMYAIQNRNKYIYTYLILL